MFRKSNRIARWYRSLICLSMGMLIAWCCLPALASADTEKTISSGTIEPYFNRTRENITEFDLDNGMKFIVLENHKAPVISFVTYANVGGVDEPDGKTGVAHFLEHLAFKGTKRIGTTDYQAEAASLNELDKAFEELQSAKATKQNDKEIAELEEKFTKIQAEADRYVKRNDLDRIISIAGGVGLNAATSYDYTIYFYSLPANKLELWMSLESERFLEPVFREFYQEQQVILEEKRLRTDNSPIDKMVDAFLAKAFDKHPYRRPIIGYEQDIRNLTPKDVKEFFDEYYYPGNLIAAIVGDVNPAEVKQLAQKYFGRYSTKTMSPKAIAAEPPQTQTKEINLELPSQPWYLEGYHSPAITHPDRAVYEVISVIMSDGRTSRLYKSLVEEKQLALSAAGYSGFPANKYPNLTLFYAMTAPGHTVEEVAKGLDEEIDRLKTDLVSNQELERAKTQLKATLLRRLDSNLGMANLLAEYQAKTGSWSNIFEELKAIESVTAADVRRVAKATFTNENKTIGRLLSSPSEPTN